MFDAKEEKANFKVENESQPSIHHFGDRYKVTNRKPYFNIISETQYRGQGATNTNYVWGVF